MFSTLKSKTWVAQLAECQRQEDGSSPFPTTLLRCWLASQTPWKVNSSLLFCCKLTPTRDFSTKRNSSYLVLMFSKFRKSQTKNHVFMQANQPQTSRPREVPGEEDLPVTWPGHWLVVYTIWFSGFIFWSLHYLYQTWSENTKQKILRLNTILSVKIFPPPHPFLPWLLWISLPSTK